MLPTPNGSLGRDLTSGRFTTGNPGGPGNPYARRVAAMRTQLLDAVDSAASQRWHGRCWPQRRLVTLQPPGWC